MSNYAPDGYWAYRLIQLQEAHAEAVANKKREEEAARSAANATHAASMACDAAALACHAVGSLMRIYPAMTASRTELNMYLIGGSSLSTTAAKGLRDALGFRQLYCIDHSIAATETAAAAAALDQVAAAAAAAAESAAAEPSYKFIMTLRSSSESAVRLAAAAAAAFARGAENPAAALFALSTKLANMRQDALAKSVLAESLPSASCVRVPLTQLDARIAATAQALRHPDTGGYSPGSAEYNAWRKREREQHYQYLKDETERQKAAAERALAEKELAELFAAQTMPRPTIATPPLAEKELVDLFTMQLDPPTLPASAEPSSVQKRKGIPKKIRDKVWNNAFGPVIKGNCVCCKEEIDFRKWDCAHIKAHKEGGTDAEENLRPTCVGCNRSMGVENLFEFKMRCYPDK